jgi:predicted nucleic acid-binding protein
MIRRAGSAATGNGIAKMPMRVACFLDTNILLYAALGKNDEPKKFQVSRDLIAAWNFGLSTQVLGEFFVNAQRKSRRPLSAGEAAAIVAELEQRPCAAVDQSLVHVAIDYAQQFRISYWDAAIIAAAERLQAGIVYSEDFDHGQVYGAVRVEDPFRVN